MPSKNAPDFSRLPSWALTVLLAVYRELNKVELCVAVEAVLTDKIFDTTADSAWYDWFPTVRRPEKRTIPERFGDWKKINENAVVDHFRNGGSISKLMTSYEARQGQLKMAREVASAFNSSSHLFVEAGTGVGKSLAYLVPAAMWAIANNVPVVVSTNTKNLQSQLIVKDAPIVQKILGPALRVSVLKGRSNYLCLKSLGSVIDSKLSSLDSAELAMFAEIILWSCSTQDGDLDSLSAGNGNVKFNMKFVHQFGCSREECTGKKCRLYNKCFLQKARTKAAESHIIIANHALLFSEMQVPGSALPPYVQVVFDEAHNLEDAATRHLSQEISPNLIYSVCQKISLAKGKSGYSLVDFLQKSFVDSCIDLTEPARLNLIGYLAELQTTAAEIAKAANRLFATLYKFFEKTKEDTIRYRSVVDLEKSEPPLPPAFKREINFSQTFVPSGNIVPDDIVEQEKIAVIQRFRDAAKLMERFSLVVEAHNTSDAKPYSDVLGSIKNISDVCGETADLLTVLVDAKENNFVYWMERSKFQKDSIVQLFSAPLSIASQLNKVLYSSKYSIIFSSATLRVNNDFAHVMHRLGADRITQENGEIAVKTFVAESPFDYEKQCIACVPAYLPDPPSGMSDKNNQYVLELSRTLFRLFIHAKGRSLVLFTSYDMMRKSAELMQKHLEEKNITLLMQSEMVSRDAITKQFRENLNATVLFGTQSFWEGVDIAGDALSCLVMARLPFDAATDPLFKARKEVIEREGRSSFRELNLPQAVIKFRQGFGRLIRTSSDHGIVVIADSRIIKNSYGSVFARSLPVPLQRIDSPKLLVQKLQEIIK